MKKKIMVTLLFLATKLSLAATPHPLLTPELQCIIRMLHNNQELRNSPEIMKAFLCIIHDCRDFNEVVALLHKSPKDFTFWNPYPGKTIEALHTAAAIAGIDEFDIKKARWEAERQQAIQENRLSEWEMNNTSGINKTPVYK